MYRHYCSHRNRSHGALHRLQNCSVTAARRGLCGDIRRLDDDGPTAHGARRVRAQPPVDALGVKRVPALRQPPHRLSFLRQTEAHRALPPAATVAAAAAAVDVSLQLERRKRGDRAAIEPAPDAEEIVDRRDGGVRVAAAAAAAAAAATAEFVKEEDERQKDDPAADEDADDGEPLADVARFASPELVRQVGEKRHN